MYKIRTVIVELEHPIDSDDPYLNTSVSDEYYGEGESWSIVRIASGTKRANG